jgi:hemoglobin
MNTEVSEAAPPVAAAKPPTPYERIGGEATVRRIVDRFYDLMAADATVAPLRRMHADDLTPMRERLTDFMIGWLGGPPRYFQRADARCMGQAHAPFAIDAAIREQWLSCMTRALDEARLDDGLRALIGAALARMTEGMRNG